MGQWSQAPESPFTGDHRGGCSPVLPTPTVRPPGPRSAPGLPGPREVTGQGLRCPVNRARFRVPPGTSQHECCQLSAAFWKLETALLQEVGGEDGIHCPRDSLTLPAPPQGWAAASPLGAASPPSRMPGPPPPSCQPPTCPSPWAAGT